MSSPSPTATSEPAAGPPSVAVTPAPAPASAPVPVSDSAAAAAAAAAVGSPGKSPRARKAKNQAANDAVVSTPASAAAPEPAQPAPAAGAGSPVSSPRGRKAKGAASPASPAPNAAAGPPPATQAAQRSAGAEATEAGKERPAQTPRKLGRAATQAQAAESEEQGRASPSAPAVTQSPPAAAAVDTVASPSPPVAGAAAAAKPKQARQPKQQKRQARNAPQAQAQVQAQAQAPSSAGVTTTVAAPSTSPVPATSDAPAKAPRQKQERQAVQGERVRAKSANVQGKTEKAAPTVAGDANGQKADGRARKAPQTARAQATKPPAAATAAAVPSTARPASASPPTVAAAAAPSGPTKRPMSSFASSAAPSSARPPVSPAPAPVSVPAAAVKSAPSVPPSIHAPASNRDIIVLKVGSASLSTDDCKLLQLSNICSLVECICTLKKRGFHVILVTSGAVAVGCQRLGLNERPTSLITKQAVAAIGQSRLMRVYDDLFSAMSQPIAQVLLSRENLRQHHHYVNALNTFRELLRLGVVPIVNENDTVAVEELKVGDNDTLSALVASLLNAKWLFLLTDVAGLYDSDPRSNPSAKLVHTVSDISELNVNLGSSGSLGTGGMSTKLVAAQIATAAGVHTGILKTTELGNITRMMNGEAAGTHFLPNARPLKSHKRWIAHGLKPEGAILLDAGACDSVLNKKSLFSAGVVGVSGTFAAGASVRLLRQPATATGGTPSASPASPAVAAAPSASSSPSPSPSPSSSPAAASSSPSGAASAAAPAGSPRPGVRVWQASECAGLNEVGVCVVNYNSDEVLKLAGHHSADFAAILGYGAPAELANRENIALKPARSPKANTAETAAGTSDASAAKQ